MSLVFDILHLAVAALLAIIGIGYEREEECTPVHFQPAAEIQTVHASQPQMTYVAVVETSDCGSAPGVVRLPAL
jgi:hypothetical protein